jgi:hypothetical protein
MFNLFAATVEDGPIDVEVGSGRVSHHTAITNGCVRASEDEALLSWEGAGAFLVRHGREIVVDARPDADPRFIAHLIAGPALAVVLHQRGRLVLHASAVSVGGEIVAFLGHSGCGKSTVAAALHARGCTLVTDDVLATDATAETPVGYPGFPGVKLWPGVIDVIKELNDAFEPQSALHPQIDKRAYGAGRNFSTQPLPFRRLYTLSEGAEARVEEIEPRAALVEMIRHTFTARVLTSAQTAPHFTQCARLASKVRARRLVSPRSPSELVALAELIERDLAAA